MALIDRTGLFAGERISSCSDMSQLHWVRLFVASNSYGRFEVNYQQILVSAYSSFRSKPSEDEVMAWIGEYADHFLLFIYSAADGSVWGQWMTDNTYLKRYHTSEDRKSPAPDKDQIEAFRQSYIKSKLHKHSRINNILKPFQTVQTFPLGVGIGVGVGVGKNLKPCSPEAANDGVPTPPPLEIPQKLVEPPPPAARALEPRGAIYEAYPRKVARRSALQAITAAERRLVSGEGALPPMPALDARKYLWKRTTAYARSPAAKQGHLTPHPATWFNGSRYLDADSEWQITGSHGNGTYPRNLSPAEERQRQSRDAIANAGAALIANLDFDGADASELSDADSPAGNAGAVDSEVAEDRGAIQPGDPPNGAGAVDGNGEILTPARGREGNGGGDRE